MGYFAGAKDLRNLLAVAIKLRGLAQDTVIESDRRLYLTAAAALESRAATMAAGLPDDAHDRETVLHQPVDVRI